MELKDLIYKRKSCRSYTGKPVDSGTLENIRAFVSAAKPLYPHIRVQMDIAEKDSVRCIFPWVTPQLICIYSEETEGFLENAGFIFQQLDLYMQSLGLGVCWLGMGRLTSKEAGTAEKEGLEFVIMLSFGHPKGSPHRNPEGFKRKKLSQISDIEDSRLDPARLAPSSVNSQPWYFVHEGEIIHVYCALQGKLINRFLSDMNRIDIGIALAHLYVSNPDSFSFSYRDDARRLKGYEYMGSVII